MLVEFECIFKFHLKYSHPSHTVVRVAREIISPLIVLLNFGFDEV